MVKKYCTQIEKYVKSKVKLATVVGRWTQGSLFDSYYNQDVGEGANPFPVLSDFTLDPYSVMPSVLQGGIKYHLLSLWYE